MIHINYIQTYNLMDGESTFNIYGILSSSEYLFAKTYYLVMQYRDSIDFSRLNGPCYQVLVFSFYVKMPIIKMVDLTYGKKFEYIYEANND